MLCSFKFLISTFLVQVAFSCDSSVSEGPCDGSTITCSTQECDTSAGMCCPATSSSTSTSTTTSSSSSSNCLDKLNPSTGVSDCPKRAYLCNDTTYYDVMTYQCPHTCGRCNLLTTTAHHGCIDLLNPSTGVSDCPKRSYLCDDTVYYDVMTVQCPKTCGRCNSTSTSTSTSSSSSSTSTSTSTSATTSA